MARVTVKVGSESFDIPSDDDPAAIAAIEKTAHQMNQEIEHIIATLGNVGTARILAIYGLMTRHCQTLAEDGQKANLFDTIDLLTMKPQGEA